jgi:hypothetical protein
MCQVSYCSRLRAARGGDGHQQEQPERDGRQEHVRILRVEVGDLAGDAAISHVGVPEDGQQCVGDRESDDPPAHPGVQQGELVAADLAVQRGNPGHQQQCREHRVARLEPGEAGQVKQRALSSPPRVLNSHHPEMPTAPPRTHPRTRRAFTGLEAAVAVVCSTLMA